MTIILLILCAIGWITAISLQRSFTARQETMIRLLNDGMFENKIMIQIIRYLLYNPSPQADFDVSVDRKVFTVTTDGNNVTFKPKHR